MCERSITTIASHTIPVVPRIAAAGERSDCVGAIGLRVTVIRVSGAFVDLYWTRWRYNCSFKMKEEKLR